MNSSSSSSSSSRSGETRDRSPVEVNSNSKRRRTITEATSSDINEENKRAVQDHEILQDIKTSERKNQDISDIVMIVSDDEHSVETETKAAMDTAREVRLAHNRLTQSDEFMNFVLAILSTGSVVDPSFERITLPRDNTLDKLQVLMDDNQVPADENCSVCLETVSGVQSSHIVKPPDCNHYFHLACAEPWFRDHSDCPVCRVPVTVVMGMQPDHADNIVMENISTEDLPGFDGDGTLEMIFFMPSGIQNLHHPLPGSPYHGESVRAFLPHNSEGKEAARLLRLAFARKLLFRIGFNEATNKHDQIIVNGIELKTRRYGGYTVQGYPDPTYFCRLKIDLREMGVY